MDIKTKYRHQQQKLYQMNRQKENTFNNLKNIIFDLVDIILEKIPDEDLSETVEKVKKILSQSKM